MKTEVSVYLVACGVVTNQDLFRCLFQSGTVFSSLVEYQERIALSSLSNSYSFRDFTPFHQILSYESVPFHQI